MVTRYRGSLEIAPEALTLKLLGNGVSVVVVILGFFVGSLHSLGYTSSIAASYGDVGQVCGIEASGDQNVLCWGKNNNTLSTSSVSIAFSVLSGGNDLMCGLRVGSSSPYCWSGNWSDARIVPNRTSISYSTIATGESHVCAVRSQTGEVDCWTQDAEGQMDPPAGASYLSSVVAGRGFTCGLSGSQFPICWGRSEHGITSAPQVEFESLAAGIGHVCGVVRGSKRVRCWGDNSMKQANPPSDISFAAVTTGQYHSCGIRDDTHEVVCWGDEDFDFSSAKGFSFLALTSAPNMTCGIREDTLLAMCWGSDIAKTKFAPPLDLFSPGLCTSTPCDGDTFYFNASTITNSATSSTSNICVDSNAQICAPCARACPSGSFLSGSCGHALDRSCIDCTLCFAGFCQTSCGNTTFPTATPLQSKSSSSRKPQGTASIIGAAVSGAVAVAVLGALVFCFMYRKRVRYHFFGCASREKLSENGGLTPPGSNPGSTIGRRNGVSHEIVRMQAFRLSELKDATNGFKELNELGRGSYGFVYKANLPDGRLVAVKRANAARRIQSRSRDFEAELEVLCKVHHAHLVNLVGYCEEMGERLLVYEFMPHGTLHDHLHGGLAQLSWHLRLKVAAQAARGIEYLHKDASPRIIHRDIKSSNVLLDGEWGARVADFGLALPERERGPPPSMKPSEVAYVDPEYLKTQIYTEKSDVYSFGVVLLEILCGRKAYDSALEPPNIVDWATPYIRRGKSVEIFDQSLDLPKNVEPLKRVAEIVELCVKSSPRERPSMTDVASWLELVGRSSAL